MIRCVLFDLDGTLVDTAPEIADAINDTLRRLKRPPVPETLARGWIGDGTRATLGRALAHAGLPEHELSRIWPLFQRDYLDRCGTRSEVYPQVQDTLKRLSAMGVPMAAWFFLAAAVPPNAIVFSSEYLGIGQMARAGLCGEGCRNRIVTLAGSLLIPVVFVP